MQCGFVGNSDIYGIGIRIGYYTQALAVWFADYFHLGELNGLRAVNKLFTFALVIAGSIYAYEARSTYAIEAFLLLNVGICIGFVGILETSRYTSRNIRTSKERLLLRIVVVYVGLTFNACFWWRGLDVMLPTPCSATDSSPTAGSAPLDESTRHTYALFVIKTDLYGWMRSVMRIISLTGLIWTVFVRAASDPVHLMHSALMQQTREEFTDAATSVSSDHKDGTERRANGPRAQCQGSIKPLINDQANAPIVDRTDSSPTHLVDSGGSAAAAAAASMASTKSEVPLRYGERQIMLEAIRNAELYLSSIFAAFEEREALLGHRRLITLWNGRIRFYFPRSNTQNFEWPSYARTWYIALVSVCVGPIPINLRWRLQIHKMGLPQPIDWTRMLFRAYEISEKDKPPDWRLVAIASDIQLSQMPLQKTGLAWAFQALQHLGLIIGLIVQVELTISWNHITGLQTLSSLGQLIPFILGVGGLLQVLWGKWCLLRKGIKEASDSRNQGSQAYEAAIAKYLVWKSVQEKREPTTKRSGSPPTEDLIGHAVIQIPNSCADRRT